MKLNTVENILNDMLVALDEFKSEDVKYYERQVSRIITYIKALEKQKGVSE